MGGKIHELDAQHHGAMLHVDEQSNPAVRTLLQELAADRDRRGWDHKLKNLAMALNVEASEVLEIFTWKDLDEELTDTERAHTAEELADVLIYVFDMCNRLDLDPLKIVAAKQKINAGRHWGAKS